MSEAEKNLVPALEAGEVSTFYTKLGELSEEQQGKGYYASLVANESLSGVLRGITKNKYGKNEYAIERADGKVQAIANAGNLDRQMNAVKVGTYVQITYNGKAKITKGEWAGQDSHTFTVLKEQI